MLLYQSKDPKYLFGSYKTSKQRDTHIPEAHPHMTNASLGIISRYTGHNKHIYSARRGASWKLARFINHVITMENRKELDQVIDIFLVESTYIGNSQSFCRHSSAWWHMSWRRERGRKLPNHVWPVEFLDACIAFCAAKIFVWHLQRQCQVVLAPEASQLSFMLED